MFYLFPFAYVYFYIPIFFSKQICLKRKYCRLIPFHTFIIRDPKCTDKSRKTDCANNVFR